LPVLPSTEIKLTMNQVYNIVNININFLSIITHTPLPYREPFERSDIPVYAYQNLNNIWLTPLCRRVFIQSETPNNWGFKLV
jgi:hypothetical protein